MSLVLVLDRIEGKYSKILFKENSLTYDSRVLNDLLIEEHSVSIAKDPGSFPPKPRLLNHTRDLKVSLPRPPL